MASGFLSYFVICLVLAYFGLTNFVKIYIDDMDIFGLWMLTPMKNCNGELTISGKLKFILHISSTDCDFLYNVFFLSINPLEQMSSWDDHKYCVLIFYCQL